MRISNCFSLLPLMLAIQSIGSQVQPGAGTEVGALAAPLKHVRSDLPSGAIALQLNEDMPTNVRDALALALHMPLRRSAELTECYQPPKGAKACRFIGGFVGALGVMSTEPLSN